MKKLDLSLLVTCLALLALAACVDNTRDPQVSTTGLPDIYTVELLGNHRTYEFGELVHLRATLTNVSTYTLTFTGESAIDIRLIGADLKERLWSQENRGQVKPVVILAPQESYIITWTLSLSSRTDYRADIIWADPAGYPSDASLIPGTKRQLPSIVIYYGIRPYEL